MKLSLIIPCYNEALNLPILVKRIEETFNQEDVEVILVNNGSTDNSSDVLTELCKKSEVIRSVNVDVNQGYGFGILSGLNAAKHDVLGWTHADMQTDPADALKALEYFKQSHNPHELFVKGWRVGRPLGDSVFTTGMSIFESCLMGCKLTDINAQPTIFSKKFYSTWDTPPYDFSLDLYAFYRARKSKLNVERFNVKFGDRAFGSSHWNIDFSSKIKFIKRTVSFSWKLRFNSNEGKD